MGIGDSTPDIPVFGSPAWMLEVRRLVTSHAPQRFGVVGHDPATENSAILAWGLDYGDGEVVIESAQDDRRWTLNDAEAIRAYFPNAPEDGLELVWIDDPAVS